MHLNPHALEFFGNKLRGFYLFKGAFRVGMQMVTPCGKLLFELFLIHHNLQLRLSRALGAL
ncbi:hypothetical protein D3C76_1857470 [compost metagenome]